MVSLRRPINTNIFSTKCLQREPRLTIREKQAPNPALPKRKRGRPSNASKRAEAAAAAARARESGEPIGNASRSTVVQGRPHNSVGQPSATRPTTIGRRNIPQPQSGPIFRRQSPASPPPTRPAPATATRATATRAGPSTHQRRSSINQVSDDDSDEEMPPSPEKPYVHVAPRIRRIRQATIEAKWSPLTRPSLVTLSSVLQLAHRPIMQRLSNTQQRRTHTSTALRLVTGRIAKKIGRGLPFPPSSMVAPRGRGSGVRGRSKNLPDAGRAAELNFETVLDTKLELERQLDPALHAVHLLKKEKEHMLRELALDREALKNLETGAKAQANENRSLLKKTHALAPEIPDAGIKTEPDEVVFELPDKPAVDPFQVCGPFLFSPAFVSQLRQRKQFFFGGRFG